jgi:pimeloyl-ACP methyl ester carboxylesterase
MDPIAALKNFPRPPRRAVTGGMAALALGGIAYAAAALTSRLVREASRYRREANVLYRRWTTIPAIAGPGVLRIHSRVRDVMTNRTPIVLVHGYGIGSSYFVPLAARLSRHAPVFAPDLPGHGPSDHDARPLDVPELAQALGEWMERMGLKGAAIVGHSLGCQVAIHLAARRPELASRLLLIGPTADAAARTALAQAARSVRTSAHERPGGGALMAMDYAQAGAGVLREEMRSMLEDRPENLIGRLSCPVAIVRGERDRIVSQRWAEELARRAGAPEPIVVPGWGHAVHYDDPEAVAAMVLRHGIENGRERRATPR